MPHYVEPKAGGFSSGLSADFSCMYLHTVRDPSLRQSGLGNVFVKNLDKAVDSKVPDPPCNTAQLQCKRRCHLTDLIAKSPTFHCALALPSDRSFCEKRDLSLCAGIAISQIFLRKARSFIVRWRCHLTDLTAKSPIFHCALALPSHRSYCEKPIFRCALSWRCLPSDRSYCEKPDGSLWAGIAISQILLHGNAQQFFSKALHDIFGLFGNILSCKARASGFGFLAKKSSAPCPCLFKVLHVGRHWKS